MPTVVSNLKSSFSIDSDITLSHGDHDEHVFPIDPDHGDLIYGLTFSGYVSEVMLMLGDCIIFQWKLDETSLAFEEPMCTDLFQKYHFRIITDGTNDVTTTVTYGNLKPRFRGDVLYPVVIDENSRGEYLLYLQHNKTLCSEGSRHLVEILSRATERVTHQQGQVSESLLALYGVLSVCAFLGSLYFISKM